MANFWNSFAQQLGRGDNVKDYQHAARTFVDGLYRLAPKYQSLFHVFIDLNSAVAQSDQNSQIEIGLMAKQVTLPKYTVQNKIYNAYNRKTINQERINYDPVTLTFHDDSQNIVRDFWYKYYQHHYRDSDHQLSIYEQDHKYKQRQQQDWGFSPRVSGRAENYINAIRIYSLHQKQFSSYILIRPTITSFKHGDHTAGEYALMEHTMQVAYEAVQYESGPVANGTVLGFNVDGFHYDTTPSPLTSIGGGTRSILGPGGLVEGAGDVVTNLQNGNLLGAALGAFRTGTNFKGADLKAIARGEFEQTAKDILRGQNTQSSIFVPTQASIREGLAKATNTIR
jgi:KaiC/GvpD/RAD55 family RecA-like ATPase